MKNQKKHPSKDDILTLYIDRVLSKNKRPKSVYKFCKKIKLDEQVFHSHYSCLLDIEKYFWDQLLDQTNNLVKEQKEELPLEHELLTFYFTLLENLSLNRSAVLFFLRRSKRNPVPEFMLRQAAIPHLKPYSKKIKSIVHQLSKDAGDKFYEEALWLQFISILKFWSKDTSEECENTDVFIEKTIKLSFELHNTIPTESLIDYGKFLFKELKQKI